MEAFSLLFGGGARVGAPNTEDSSLYLLLELQWKLETYICQ